MGQRSQTYIRVLNPLHYLIKEDRGVIAEIKKNKRTKAYREYKKWEKALGTDEYTVLAYHHQWLYGLTFPSMIIKMLKFYHFEDKEDKKFANHPANPRYFIDDLFEYHDEDRTQPFNKLQRFVDFHTHVLSIVIEPWEFTREKGREGFRFLNLEDEGYRKCYNNGDNNDGVCIVDTEKCRYAFLKIQDHIESVAELPNEVPLSAERYVRAYYPLNEEHDKLRDGYTFEDIRDLENNPKRIQMAKDAFEGFDVLTREQIDLIF